MIASATNEAIESTSRLGHRRAARPRGLSFLLPAMPCQRCLDERAEKGMCRGRFGFELRMALHCQEPRMIAQLDHLDELAVGTRARDFQAVRGELLAKLVVELVAVPMPLLDH